MKSRTGKKKHVFLGVSLFRGAGRGGAEKSHERVRILMTLISAFYDACPWALDGKKIIFAAIWFREIGRSGQSHLAAIETSGGLLDPNGLRSGRLIGSKWPSHPI